MLNLKPNIMNTLALNEAKERLEELISEGKGFVVQLENGTTVLLDVKKVEKPQPMFGSGKGWFTDVSDDFDEPLEDFKDYM